MYWEGAAIRRSNLMPSWTISSASVASAFWDELKLGPVHLTGYAFLKLQVRTFSSRWLYIVSVISLRVGPMNESSSHASRSFTVVTPRLSTRFGCFMRVGSLWTESLRPPSL